tara:strand:+ start:14 stop:598 length:585 start_codon:yes stop_codon:yes gene_type:complete
MLTRFILLNIFSIIISNCSIDSVEYLNKINKVLEELSIDYNVNDEIYFESCNLVSINKNKSSKNIKLDSIAAAALLKMQYDARKKSIEFEIISGFRSFEYQKKIIIRKLNSGKRINDILKENTLPGYSEHHTGCAVDFTSKGSFSLSVDFDKTKEFKWLLNNASKYGFYLSYPKDNKRGVMYEPWHWMYTGIIN